MKITKIEDLIVWQEAVVLMKMTYKLEELMPKSELYNMVKHLKACSRNIPANIAEGFGRYHYQESLQFNRIARGSLMELKSDLLCAFELGFIGKKETDEIIAQVEKVNALLNAFIKSTIKVKK